MSLVYYIALFCILALAGLAYTSTQMTHRADSPAALLCMTWAIVLSFYTLAGNRFYAVDATTLVLLTVAPAALFIGAMLSAPHARPEPAAALQSVAFLRASVILWGLVLVLCLPAYFEHFAGEVSEDSEVNFIAAIRLATLENEGTVSDFSPLKNLQPIAYALPLVALIAFHGEKLKGTLITLVALVLGICYGLLTGSKSVVPSLGVSFCVMLIAKNGGRLRGSGTLPILSSAVLGFLALIRYVNYTYAQDVSEWDLWVSAIQGITSYLCAPVVGLDLYLRNPLLFDLSPQSLSRPYYYIANSVLNLFGQPGLMQLPSIHLPFYDPGPDYRGLDYNTYTYVGSYIESTNQLVFVLLPLSVGYLLARLHRLATPNKAFALLLYAYLARALVLSFGGELLILDFANIIKFAFVVWLLISATPRLIGGVAQWLAAARALPRT